MLFTYRNISVYAEKKFSKNSNMKGQYSSFQIVMHHIYFPRVDSCNKSINAGNNYWKIVYQTYAVITTVLVRASYYN